MSNPIWNNLIYKKNILFDKCFVVDREHQTLADFVRQVRRDKGMSLGDVRRASGNKIAQSYLFRIENGDVANVSIEKLSVLAKGLGVPEEELLAVARGRSKHEPSVKELKLVALFNSLPTERQDDVLRFVEAMKQAHGIQPVKVVGRASGKGVARPVYREGSKQPDKQQKKKIA